MDDYSQLVQRYKELMKERDEAVAMVEVKDAALRRIAGNNLQSNPCVVAEEALAITPTAALGEIQARTLEELIGVFGGPVNGSDIDSTLRITAAAKRKGE